MLAVKRREDRENEKLMDTFKKPHVAWEFVGLGLWAYYAASEVVMYDECKCKSL